MEVLVETKYKASNHLLMITKMINPIHILIKETVLIMYIIFRVLRLMYIH